MIQHTPHRYVDIKCIHFNGSRILAYSTEFSVFYRMKEKHEFYRMKASWLIRMRKPYFSGLGREFGHKEMNIFDMDTFLLTMSVNIFVFFAPKRFIQIASGYGCGNVPPSILLQFKRWVYACMTWGLFWSHVKKFKYENFCFVRRQLNILSVMR